MCTRWLDKTTKRRNRAATAQRPSSPATSVPSKGQFIFCYLTHMMSPLGCVVGNLWLTSGASEERNTNIRITSAGTAVFMFIIEIKYTLQYSASP